MCGICCLVNTDGAPASPEVVGRMTSALGHRGPDGRGESCEGGVGLGHTRLAIIDLSDAAAQPFFSADGALRLVFNGEIYNYRELRAELEGLGHVFRSSSDTEVLLEAYAAWGEDCVHRFNGMFAFVIHDTRRRRVFIARDRYGVKPLYYARAGGCLLFGSEIKAILGHPGFKARLDLEALLEYFTFQNFFTDKTLFEGVRLFPAGCRATVVLDQGAEMAIRPEVYWDFNFSEPTALADDREYLEELERLFRQAVKRQLVSDVEVGAYLSGGVDSGTITAVAAGELPYIKSFTCGFDLSSASGLEMAFDERENAERLSYLFKTEHYEMVLKAGDMERCMPALVRHIEEPRVGQSYPNFYAAKMASKFCKVVLAGTGGDEIFGGYPWRYFRCTRVESFQQYVDEYYLFWQRLIPNTSLRQAFSPVWENVKHVWTRNIFEQVYGNKPRSISSVVDSINYSLYFEAKTFLSGLLLVEDKLSMAHGLETRVPFLDNDLVDFAMRLPIRFKLGDVGEICRTVNENEPAKIHKYFSENKCGKRLLRDLLGRMVPSEQSESRKQGFSGPDASWFKGESIRFVRQLLFSGPTRIYDYLDRRQVQSLVMDHLEGRANRRLLLWSLIYFEFWCREFLE